MVDINDVFTGRTFKGSELDGEEPVLTIKQVDVKDFGTDGRKLTIHFAGEDKVLICNKTNARKIAKAFGTETAAWVGKKIQLYFDEDVEYGGKAVGGIRIRTGKVPVPAKPKPMVDDFSDSVDDIADTL